MGLWASLYQVCLCFDIAPTIDLYRLGTLLLCIGRSWAGLPYQNLLFICELLSQLVFLLFSLGKSFISIWIEPSFSARTIAEHYSYTSSLEGRFFGSSMGKVRSTYVDHLSTHERSKIHVPCPIVYARRSRERNTVLLLILVRVKAFPRGLCEAHHIEAHGCTAARALKGVERLIRRGAARGRRPHRPRHWSG